MRRIWFSILAFSVLILMIGLAILTSKVPRFEQFKNSYTSQDRAILDRNGLLVDEIHGYEKFHRFNWVEFKALPAFLQKALLDDDVELSAKVSGTTSFWANKAVSWTWRKTELAEAYINLSIYRRELAGFAAASFGIYDKNPTDLSQGEAAIILALANRAADSDAITEFACDWLVRMGAGSQCGLLAQDHLVQLEKSYRMGPFLKMAPQFTQQFASEASLVRGNVVRTTLDRELQWSSIQLLHARGLHNAAVAVIENSTGQLLAYVNTAADARDLAAHTAESVLQPLLYAEGLDERVITAGTLLEKVTPRTALAKGLSLPALATLQFVGADHFARTFTSLGLSGFEKSEEFGPSLALGRMDVRLLELANAYRTLANGGVWTPIRVSPDKLSETAPRRIFSEEAAFIAGDLLSDGNGGSFFSNDNWAVGYSSQFTVAVWASQANGAALVWLETMSGVHQHAPAVASPPPPTLVRGAAPDNKKRLRGEWFIEGTELGTADDMKLASRISYPLDHSTIAPDKNENVLIKIVAPRSNQNLYLNGERLGRAKPYQAWQPHSGRFTLELRDSQGHLVDRVRFAVRGRSFALIR